MFGGLRAGPLGVGGAESRGTTALGEYRSHARMAMIEPNSWDLNEVKVQYSLPICLFSWNFVS